MSEQEYLMVLDGCLFGALEKGQNGLAKAKTHRIFAEEFAAVTGELHGIHQMMFATTPAAVRAHAVCLCNEYHARLKELVDYFMSPEGAAQRI